MVTKFRCTAIQDVVWSWYRFCTGIKIMSPLINIYWKDLIIVGVLYGFSYSFLNLQWWFHFTCTSRTSIFFLSYPGNKEHSFGLCRWYLIGLELPNHNSLHGYLYVHSILTTASHNSLWQYRVSPFETNWECIDSISMMNLTRSLAQWCCPLAGVQSWWYSADTSVPNQNCQYNTWLCIIRQSVV